MDIPKEEFEGRIERTRTKLREYGFEALMAYSATRDYLPGNVMYLGNHFGMIDERTMVIVTRSDAVLLSDADWWTAKATQSCPIRFELTPNIGRAVKETFRKSSIKKGKIGVAGWRIFPAPIYLEVKKDFPELEFEETNALSELRLVKSRNEIELMRESARITDLMFEAGMKMIRVGNREYDVIAAAEYAMRSACAEPSWQHEIGAGVNRTRFIGPQPTEKRMEEGDLVLLDMGGSYKGYHGDITRMRSVGEPTKEQQQAFDINLEALNSEIAAMKPGVKLSEVHEAALKILRENGYEKCALSDSGHSNGLDMHEWPSINAQSDTKLASGMIFCVEPMFTPPDLGHFRLEDMVLITDTGREVLTNYPRTLWDVREWAW